jgi:hypothetical protein
MLDKLPKEILLIIIKYQIMMGDYNPACPNLYYKEVYDYYIETNTNWI